MAKASYVEIDEPENQEHLDKGVRKAQIWKGAEESAKIITGGKQYYMDKREWKEALESNKHQLERVVQLKTWTSEDLSSFNTAITKADEELAKL